ncbi:MAG: hypothetical protein V7707_02880 [Motiliproteus sp.]
MFSVTKSFTLIFFLLFLSNISNADCGDVFSTRHGPWDYNSSEGRKNLKKVEKRHFTDKVEKLIGGESTSELMGDLNYTLNKFPNHHRALMSLVKYNKLKEGTLPQTGTTFYQTVDCYFDRAFQFKPNDWKVYQIYGIHFYINKDFEESVAMFEYALSINSSAELNYNLGLSYFKIGKFQQAKEQAEISYKNGYPLSGLRDMLLKKGIQVE